MSGPITDEEKRQNEQALKEISNRTVPLKQIGILLCSLVTIGLLYNGCQSIITSFKNKHAKKEAAQAEEATVQKIYDRTHTYYFYPGSFGKKK